jgi:HlyD family secretion protein
MKPGIAGTVKRVLLWGSVLIVVAAVAYRVRFMPVTVSAQPLAMGEVVAEVMGTGTLEARYQTTVGAKIPGRIVELLADQNDHVKEGQLLARLDDAELRREVSIAKASLEASQATVERLKAEEARAKAVLEQAQRDFDRYSALVSSKSISQETIEKSKEKLAIAEAEIDKTLAATNEAVRQVTAAEERLQFQEARLADTRILCPFDGLIVRRDREAGDVVIPGASVFQMISLREMWVSAWIDESAMAGLAAGQPSRIVFRSEPDKDYKGKVARLGREVDRETREFKVDVRAEQLPANWAVGQRAEVYVETGRKSGVLGAPIGALVWKNGQPGLFRIEQGKAFRRPVKIGLRGFNRVEILEGVSKGDMVIGGSDVTTITDGLRVAVK